MIEETYLKHNRNDDTVQVAYICDIDSYEILHSFVDCIYNDDENYDVEDEEDVNVHNMVDSPNHYCSGKLETIEKIKIVLDGIEGEAAYNLGNILKYFDRAGLKDDEMQDLDKANNYAHRLVTGKWRNG